MPFFRKALIAISAALLIGCSTTQEVHVAKYGPLKPLVSVAQVADAGNSTSADTHLHSALVQEGLNVKASLPQGTRRSTDVDALVSYVDVWRWDLVMYLQALSVRIFDAQTGDLLISGQWKDSPLHGFRNAEEVMKGLVSEMMQKLRARTEPVKTAQTAGN